MAVPTDRRYRETHEWCKLDGGLATVGITQFAAEQLTDITFVGLPAVGTAVTAGEPFGEIESVKSAGDLIAPVTGEVVEVNAGLPNDPGLVNRDPFGAAWMVRIRPADPGEYQTLLDPPAYEDWIAE